MENEYKPKELLAVLPEFEEVLSEEYILNIRNRHLSKAPKQAEAYDLICSHYLKNEQPVLISELKEKSGITYFGS